MGECSMQGSTTGQPVLTLSCKTCVVRTCYNVTQ